MPRRQGKPHRGGDLWGRGETCTQRPKGNNFSVVLAHLLSFYILCYFILHVLVTVAVWNVLPLLCTHRSTESDCKFQKAHFSPSSFVSCPHCQPSSGQAPKTDQMTRRDTCPWLCFLDQADPGTSSPQALSMTRVVCDVYHSYQSTG